MENKRNSKALFDTDLATLPILIANWVDDPKNAIIIYQNEVLSKEIGSWQGVSMIDFLDKLSDNNGNGLLDELIANKVLSFPSVLNKVEIKFHSRLAVDHIQITISDNTEMNRIRDINNRSRLINTFINIGSHELKTPLNGILGLSSILLEDEVDADKKELLSFIMNSAISLDNVVLKMLKQVYSYEEKELISAVVQLNIGESIKDSINLFENCLTGRDFSSKNITLNDKMDVQLPEGYLNDILMEIAINLRRNTPPGGKVNISTFDKDNEVYLVVENENPGIPKNDLERVFEPFYRYQNKMNHSSGFEYEQAGAGMGLTILKRNVQAANGRVWFENVPPHKEGKENIVRLTIVLPGSYVNDVD